MLFHIYFIHMVASFVAPFVPPPGQTQTTTKPDPESSAPEIIVPEVIQFIKAPENLDDHALDKQIEDIAKKEQTDSEGKIIENYPNIALNLKDARELLDQNNLVAFDILKQILSGILRGCFNFAYDIIKGFFESPLAAFMPDLEKTSVWDFLLTMLFRLIMFGFVLRLMIFFTPFRPLKALLMRLQYYTMCLMCDIF